MEYDGNTPYLLKYLPIVNLVMDLDVTYSEFPIITTSTCVYPFCTGAITRCVGWVGIT